MPFILRIPVPPFPENDKLTNDTGSVCSDEEAAEEMLPAKTRRSASMQNTLVPLLDENPDACADAAMTSSTAEINPRQYQKWSAEEDELLESLVCAQQQELGPGATIPWSLLASAFPGRTDKRVRERWSNHLAPQVVKATFTNQDDVLIHRLVKQQGKKWTKIANSGLLPGRSANAIKNRYYTHQLSETRRLRREENEEKQSSDPRNLPTSLVMFHQPPLARPRFNQSLNCCVTAAAASGADHDIEVYLEQEAEVVGYEMI